MCTSQQWSALCELCQLGKPLTPLKQSNTTTTNHSFVFRSHLGSTGSPTSFSARLASVPHTFSLDDGAMDSHGDGKQKGGNPGKGKQGKKKGHNWHPFPMGARAPLPPSAQSPLHKGKGATPNDQEWPKAEPLPPSSSQAAAAAKVKAAAAKGGNPTALTPRAKVPPAVKAEAAKVAAARPPAPPIPAGSAVRPAPVAPEVKELWAGAPATAMPPNVKHAMGKGTPPSMQKQWLQGSASAASNPHGGTAPIGAVAGVSNAHQQYIQQVQQGAALYRQSLQQQAGQPEPSPDPVPRTPIDERLWFIKPVQDTSKYVGHEPAEMTAGVSPKPITLRQNSKGAYPLFDKIEPWHREKMRAIMKDVSHQHHINNVPLDAVHLPDNDDPSMLYAAWISHQVDELYPKSEQPRMREMLSRFHFHIMFARITRNEGMTRHLKSYPGFQGWRQQHSTIMRSLVLLSPDVPATAKDEGATPASVELANVASAISPTLHQECLQRDKQEVADSLLHPFRVTFRLRQMMSRNELHAGLSPAQLALMNLEMALSNAEKEVGNHQRILEFQEQIQAFWLGFEADGGNFNMICPGAKETRKYNEIFPQKVAPPPEPMPTQQEVSETVAIQQMAPNWKLEERGAEILQIIQSIFRENPSTPNVPSWRPGTARFVKAAAWLLQETSQIEAIDAALNDSITEEMLFDLALQVYDQHNGNLYKQAFRNNLLALRDREMGIQTTYRRFGAEQRDDVLPMKLNFHADSSMLPVGKQHVKDAMIKNFKSTFQHQFQDLHTDIEGGACVQDFVDKHGTHYQGIKNKVKSAVETQTSLTKGQPWNTYTQCWCFWNEFRKTTGKSGYLNEWSDQYPHIMENWEEFLAGLSTNTNSMIVGPGNYSAKESYQNLKKLIIPKIKQSGVTYFSFDTIQAQLQYGPGDNEHFLNTPENISLILRTIQELNTVQEFMINVELLCNQGRGIPQPVTLGFRDNHIPFDVTPPHGERRRKQKAGNRLRKEQRH